MIKATKPLQQEAGQQNTQNASSVVQKKEAKSSPYSTREGQKGAVQAKQKPIQAKQAPIQRAGGSSKSSNIASAMGQQYGVDTSSLQMNHNSSFPNQVGAEATIQGNKIDFAPGKDSEKNIKHEVGHYIINTQRGTPPKADTSINGQPVNTTDEAAADKMMNAPLQTKMSEGSTMDTQSKGSQSKVVQNKGGAIQAKLKVGGAFYDENSENIYDAYGHDSYGHHIKRMLEKEGTYVFTDWSEAKGFIDGNVHNKGVIGDKTIQLENKLYAIGESHDKSPKGTIDGGINPSNLIYEQSMVDDEGGDGNGKMDHTLLQSMFIITTVAETFNKGAKLGNHASYVLGTLAGVPEVGLVKQEADQGLKNKPAVLRQAAASYNLLKAKMARDSQGRTDTLNNNQMMSANMQGKAMYSDNNLTDASDFADAGDKVNDVRDYFFANQIKSNSSLPMIAVMGDDHMNGTINYLTQAGMAPDKVYRKLPGDAKAFADDIGQKVDGDGSGNDLYGALPDNMKKAKVVIGKLAPVKQQSVDFSSISLGGPPSKGQSLKKKSKKKSRKKSPKKESKLQSSSSTLQDQNVDPFTDSSWDVDFSEFSKGQEEQDFLFGNSSQSSSQQKQKQKEQDFLFGNSSQSSSDQKKKKDEWDDFPW